MRIILLPALAAMLGGCIAKTAVDVVTLPVRAVAAGVDAVTTSQDEADLKRGRDARKAEERADKERRRAEKEARQRARNEDR